MGQRLKEVIDDRMGITQDTFVLTVVQGHLLQFSQKPTGETYLQM